MSEDRYPTGTQSAIDYSIAKIAAAVSGMATTLLSNDRDSKLKQVVTRAFLDLTLPKETLDALKKQMKLSISSDDLREDRFFRELSVHIVNFARQTELIGSLDGREYVQLKYELAERFQEITTRYFESDEAKKSSNDSFIAGLLNAKDTVINKIEDGFKFGPYDARNLELTRAAQDLTKTIGKS